jgi:hypothetical protein
MTTMTLVDHHRPITSVVIGADRDCAVRCDPRRCVGANALMRIRGVRDARVGVGIARVLLADGWHRLALHPETKAAVHAYDAAGDLLPIGFPFRLIPVPPRIAIGARAGERPGSSKRSGQKTSVATRTPSLRHVNVDRQP